MLKSLSSKTNLSTLASNATNIPVISESTTQNESSGRWSAFKATLSRYCCFRSHPSEATETARGVFGGKVKSSGSSEAASEADPVSKSPGCCGKLFRGKATKSTHESEPVQSAEKTQESSRSEGSSIKNCKRIKIDWKAVGKGLVAVGKGLALIGAVVAVVTMAAAFVAASIALLGPIGIVLDLLLLLVLVK